MIKFKSLLLVSLFTVFATINPASAQDNKPSAESIRQLFVLTNTPSMLNNLTQQLDGMMKNVMEEALKGQPATEAQQKQLDKFRMKIVAIQTEEMKWEKLEPVFINIYSESLTQDDVNGIIAFYKSDAGQAYIKKMPVMMQNTMAAMQKMIVPMMAKISEASKELATDLEKTKK
ncbi:hypothetical protein AAKU64_002856 [Undibacterium sp. GrIS 1.8]|uniref:DUF2059 domain-containing protein n=1 Tax=unclassified Undibacterium TaxID=2630295 RepID=UPI00339B1798